MKVFSPFAKMTKKEKLETCEALTESQFPIREVEKSKKETSTGIQKSKQKKSTSKLYA